MKLPRRNFLHLAAGAAVLPIVSGSARAQAYPSRPARIIVGFAAGGNLDMIARLMGQWLSERLGQPFIIENRPGAGANIATEKTVVRAPADEYTLLMVGPTQAKAQFQFHSRHRAGCWHHKHGQRYDREPIGSSQDRSRFHRLRVIQAQYPDIPVMRIYMGTLPFLVADFVLVALLIFMPSIALWLPRVLE